MRISDWSSDVCSSDLHSAPSCQRGECGIESPRSTASPLAMSNSTPPSLRCARQPCGASLSARQLANAGRPSRIAMRSEEHTSELQSLMRISYAVFCLKKKIITQINRCHRINTLLYTTHSYHTILIQTCPTHTS